MFIPLSASSEHYYPVHEHMPVFGRISVYVYMYVIKKALFCILPVINCCHTCLLLALRIYVTKDAGLT